MKHPPTVSRSSQFFLGNIQSLIESDTNEDLNLLNNLQSSDLSYSLSERDAENGAGSSCQLYAATNKNGNGPLYFLSLSALLIFYVQKRFRLK